jgi:hypothetical protein
MTEVTNPSDTGGRLIAATKAKRQMVGEKLGSV